MADIDDLKDGKDFGLDQPQDKQSFIIKGNAHYDWGLKNRMSRIFNPKSGRTVMLAFDHGYFQGPTRGLERIDLNILPLVEHADVMMCTRGVLRSMIPPTITKPVVIRASGGNSVLRDLENETIAVDIEDAIRMGVTAMAAQVYIGSDYEHKSIKNVIDLIDSGQRYGIPTLAVTGVGKDMARDARYFGLATRIAAEIGSHYVKSYFVEEGFERVCAACPVPIVIAGGKKLPERDALDMAYKAIDQGAAGVDMGRNIFQADDPVAMIQAVGKVVHDLETPDQAYQMYLDLKA
ncbi:MAG: 3-hydroxy-5-phosphonooxypentane-2,4-dione thiolase [Litoreibacter sp.]|nr:3-hydroxy-5-phosphonooxypentane-2,4-dione thiolase [Litoreibacter sp.]